MVVQGDDMWVCGVTQTSFAYRNHHLEGKLIEIKTTDTSDFSRLSMLASGKSIIVAFSREHKVYCLTLGQEEQEALNPVTEMTEAVTSLCLFSHNNRCSLAINTADNIISLWDCQLQSTTSTLNHEGRAGFIRNIPYWGVVLFNQFGESFQWDLENRQLIESSGPPTPIEGISPPKYLDELFEFNPNAHARAALVIQEGFLRLVILNKHHATIFTPHCAPLDSNVPSWIDTITNWFWGTT